VHSGDAIGPLGRGEPITIRQTIERIPSWASASSAAITPLPGGITNANYRVDVDGESFVVRIPADNAAMLGIDRHREYQCTMAAGRSGVAPEVVAFLPDVGVLVTRFVPGRHPTAVEMVTPEMMARVVDSVRAYHEGPAFEGTFSPFRAIEHYLHTARRHGAPLPPDADTLVTRLGAIEAALSPAGGLIRPCHNDLWDPNLIDDGTRIRIVDWEYAGMGDAYFDLASFAIHHELSDAQDRALLRRYFGDVPAMGVARLELLRAAAELREAMWCMVGMYVSSIEFDFIGYAATHFERYRGALADPRMRDWFAGAAGTR
jgi:thiamine kinase-like enzyme